MLLLILAVSLPGLLEVLKTRQVDGIAWFLVLVIGMVPMMVGSGKPGHANTF